MNFKFRELPECKHLFPTQMKIDGISVERKIRKRSMIKCELNATWFILKVQVETLEA